MPRTCGVVVAPSSAEESERLITGLRPMPDGLAWIDLLEPEDLDGFLAAE
ncbi:hypothetical protein ABZW18_00150 [Streptomyces sp. NPDC004647]